MNIPEIPFHEFTSRYPRHLKAVREAATSLEKVRVLIRHYVRVTGENPVHPEIDAIAFRAKRNAIAEYKREWRTLAR